MLPELLSLYWVVAELVWLLLWVEARDNRSNSSVSLRTSSFIKLFSIDSKIIKTTQIIK